MLRKLAITGMIMMPFVFGNCKNVEKEELKVRTVNLSYVMRDRSDGMVSVNRKARSKDRFERYVDENLEGIFEIIRSKIGAPDFDLPEVRVESFPYGSKNIGLYNVKENKITIDKDSTYLPQDLMTEELGRKFLNRRYLPFEEVLEHEVGHYISDVISERMGLGDWPDLERSENWNGEKFVSEGLAECFGRTWGKYADKKIDYIWDEKNVSIGFFYVKGRETLDPIIERFGVKGVEYLIECSPDRDDLGNLENYQKRALGELEEGY